MDHFSGGRSTECIVDGAIRANGGDHGASSVDKSGGGPGGAIWIDAGSLSGSGNIEANGGTSGRYSPTGDVGGSGGGGRVAIYYDTMGFPEENITAGSGSGGNTGASGTIYLKNNSETYGELIINKGGVSAGKYTECLSTFERFHNLKIINYSILNLNSSIKIEGELLISNNGEIIKP